MTGEVAPRVAIDTAKLDAVFADLNRSDRPGCAIGVAHRGVPVYRRGFGLANRELPVALSPSMRMRIFSITKHFCCLAIMLLAEEGKLAIDDSPRVLLPELGAWADAVTIRQLMGHISGMRCSLDLLSITNGVARPSPIDAQSLLLARLDSVNAAPGQVFNYCNGGYMLLTDIVARASGTSFGDFLKARVLTPIGMHDSEVRPFDDDCRPNTATCHLPDGKGGYLRGSLGAATEGMGGLISTVDDMLRWMAHMDAPVVGTPATWAAMQTPMTLENGYDTTYGMGLISSQHRGVATIEHSGGGIGGASQIIKLRDHALDIVVIANSGEVNPVLLAEQVIDACIESLPPKMEQPGSTPVTGMFGNGAKVVRLFDQDGKQGMEYFGTPIIVRPQADGSSWVRINTTTGATLRIDGDGDAIELTEFDRTERLEPMVLPAVPEAASIAGRYRCPTLEAEGEIVANDDGSATLRMAGPYGRVDYALTAVGPDLWMAKSSGLLAMSALIATAADGFDLSSLRTRGLRFDRVAVTGT